MQQFYIQQKEEQQAMREDTSGVYYRVAQQPNSLPVNVIYVYHERFYSLSEAFNFLLDDFGLWVNTVSDFYGIYKEIDNKLLLLEDRETITDLYAEYGKKWLGKDDRMSVDDFLNNGGVAPVFLPSVVKIPDNFNAGINTWHEMRYDTRSA